MSLFYDNFLTPQTAEFIPKIPSARVISIRDEFEVKYTVPERSFMTDTELVAASPGSVMIFDSELLPTYVLFAFKHCDSGKYLTFEHPFDVGKLKWLLERFLIVGFNSRNFDIPIVSMATNGYGINDLKDAANKIIRGNMYPYQIEQSYNFKVLPLNHIDLIEVAPLIGSLKLYAGRLHCKRMQEIPIDPDSIPTKEEKQDVFNYCLNDLDNTELVFNFLKPQLELRYNLSCRYHVDLRSKSDAQIAEAVISKELERLTGRKPEKNLNTVQDFQYRMPQWLSYHSREPKEFQLMIASTWFRVAENGEVKIPSLITNIKIQVGDKKYYRVGIGGLHSIETKSAHIADADFCLLDRDVASYYPSIALNQGLYPLHLGEPFLNVYQAIVNQRLAAKKSGDKVISDALKITINGTFGKFGNRWSILYSPELLIQVTITGQLALLMLIDSIEALDSSAHVISANTDGVLIRCRHSDRQLVADTIEQWEFITGFKTEETEYAAVYARDVNNYIAIKSNGELKLKGSYSERGSSGDSPLSRNPEAFICNDAAIQFLTKNIPIEETIRECKDVRRFVVVRNVKGGATKENRYLGKTIRWYYSTKMHGDIQYKLSGNRVPMSNGAMPLMELLDSLPPDINYKRYIGIARGILVEIGAILPNPNEELCQTFAFAFNK